MLYGQLPVVETLEDRRRHWDRRAKLPGYLPVLSSSLTDTLQAEVSSLRFIGKVISFVDEIRKKRTFSRHSPVLDIGCGIGRLITRLAVQTVKERKSRRAHTVWVNLTGVDFSAEMLKRARYAALFLGVSRRIKFFKAAATELLVPSGLFTKEAFELVIFGTVLIHILDDYEWQQALQESSELLKPNGVLLIYEPMIDSNPQYRGLKSGMKNDYTKIRRRRDYSRALRSLGLRKFLGPREVKFYDEFYTVVCFIKKPC